VDNNSKLKKSLARIMMNEVPQLQALVEKFKVPVIEHKPDGTPVTLLDEALSKHIEQVCLQHYSHLTFYSEEKFSKWEFPLMALDPLDGTREYILGRPEWAISIGLFEDEKFHGEGWVFNPLTHECFADVTRISFTAKAAYSGEVSHSEWNNGLYHEKTTPKFQVKPVGSIAYKLGRLSAGKCDFVISLRPKNIWDIAGGTILCQQAGMKFYAEGVEVNEVLQSYEPPLIWCHEELFSELSALFP